MDTTEIKELLIGGAALITAIGALSTLINLWLNRRSRDANAEVLEAQAAEVIGKAWSQVCDSLRVKIDRQGAEIEKLTKRIKDLEDKAEEDEVTIKLLREGIENRDKRIADLEGEVEILRNRIAKLAGRAT